MKLQNAVAHGPDRAGGRIAINAKADDVGIGRKDVDQSVELAALFPGGRGDEAALWGFGRAAAPPQETAGRSEQTPQFCGGQGADFCCHSRRISTESRPMRVDAERRQMAEKQNRRPHAADSAKRIGQARSLVLIQRRQRPQGDADPEHGNSSARPERRNCRAAGSPARAGPKIGRPAPD